VSDCGERGKKFSFSPHKHRTEPINNERGEGEGVCILFQGERKKKPSIIKISLHTGNAQGGKKKRKRRFRTFGNEMEQLALEKKRTNSSPSARKEKKKGKVESVAPLLRKRGTTRSTVRRGGPAFNGGKGEKIKPSLPTRRGRTVSSPTKGKRGLRRPPRSGKKRKEGKKKGGGGVAVGDARTTQTESAPRKKV